MPHLRSVFKLNTIFIANGEKKDMTFLNCGFEYFDQTLPQCTSKNVCMCLTHVTLSRFVQTFQFFSLFHFFFSQ